MKISLKILFLLSCVLVLSACTNPLKKTEITQDQARIYSCDDLKNNTFRTDCENQVNDIILNILSSEIVKTFDAKRCVNLPQLMAEDCVNTIKESGVQGPISDYQVKALNEAISLVYKTVQGPEGEVTTEGEGAYDISKCAQFNVPGLKEYCEKKVNTRIEQEKMFKIIEGGDVTKCDELKEKSLKNSCKMEFGVEVEEPEVDIPEPEVNNEPVEPEENTESAEGEVMP